MGLAIFGGGCFWCLEAAFSRLDGVRKVTSGYCGGTTPNPDYTSVCGGNTGHAEVVRIDFDPAVIDYRSLLDVFFTLHDPTTPDRQGYDIGSQYRSLIVALDEAQWQIASDHLREEAGRHPAPVVTELRREQPFYPAEAEHADYYDRHPQQPYCAAVIAPKLAKLRDKHRSLLAANPPG